MKELTTRQKVSNLRKENPSMTLEQIGSQVGVTKQRVLAILKSEQLPTRGKRRVDTFCQQCGIATAGNKFCSNECRFSYRNPVKKCEFCRAEFNIPRSNYNKLTKAGKPFYHNLECFHLDQQAKKSARDFESLTLRGKAAKEMMDYMDKSKPDAEKEKQHKADAEFHRKVKVT